MLEFNIKTWSCSSCTYRQDFDPTAENVKLHFNDDPNFRVFDLQASECPSCALKGVRGINLVKEADSSKKIKFACFETQEDIDTLRADEERLPKDVFIGMAKITEPSSEKLVRIDKEVAKVSHLPKVARDTIRLQLETAPDLLVDKEITRQETPDEMRDRLDKHFSEVTFKTPQEIAALRALHEDV